MGKKTKIGKQRKDKYYQLAKETGYRSRAAFKLIQLNRKFEFLQKSRICIDLCAAPGGWMQVAKQNMPLSSIVIGVDLFPISPIGGCISLVEDITTDKCRVAISRELKTWKADVVLNDGAPNVGTNWIHDAFKQSVLTLAALKIATQFLKSGGWFISKIFRSKDYEPLLWVLKQLFKKVHATKPQASRAESAEIFVVCEHFIAPDKLDPKFLDPKYVFSELELQPVKKLNIHHPERVNRKPEGYPENDYTLYHELLVTDFISHGNAIEALQNASAIVINDEKVANHEKTTNEIKECCKDIKVLGKKDLRRILNWWKALREDFKESESKVDDSVPNENGENEKKPVTIDELEDMEDMKISKEIEDLKAEELKEFKKKRKKAGKERQKLNQRLNLKMIHKGDEGPTLEGDDMFTLRQIRTEKDLQNVIDQVPDIVAESDTDSDDKHEKPKKVVYEKDKGYLDSSGLYYRTEEDELEENLDNLSDQNSDSNVSGLGLTQSDEESVPTQVSKKRKASEDIENNPLLTDLDYRDKASKKIHRANLWFERDIFKNLEDEGDEDFELNKMIEEHKKKGGKVIGEQHNVEKKLDKFQKDGSKGSNRMNVQSDGEGDNSDSDYNIEDAIVTNEKEKKNETKNNSDTLTKQNSTKLKQKRKLSEKELALGSLLIQSKKSRRDIIDAAWNRYAFNDENLPDWFALDEEKHMKKEAPVPNELVEDYKKSVQDLNVRPIKKVLEAKARKKKRAIRKLEKAKKKAEAILDDAAMGDHEKAKQIKALYKKAQKPPKKTVTYVVAKKHLAQKKAIRPAGIKGRYKVVDPRMKKDLRAAKMKEKANKKRGKKTRNSKPPRGKPKAPKGKKKK